MRLFGRNPTLWLQGLQGLVALLAAFGFAGLTDAQAGAIVAAAAALLGAMNAVMVRPIAPAAFTAVVTTVAALTTTFGLDFTQAQIGAAQVFVIGVLALITREQVSPAADPRPGFRT